MKNKVLSFVVIFFWIIVFGYLLYKGLVAVAIISTILLGMALAFAQAEE